MYRCAKCRQVFKNETIYKKHNERKICHRYRCPKCAQHHPNHKEYRKHLKSCLPKINTKQARMQIVENEDDDGCVELRRAFDGKMVSYMIKNINNFEIAATFLKEILEKIKRKIYHHLSRWNSLTFNMGLETTYVKALEREEVDRLFKTKSQAVYNFTDLEQLLTDSFDKMINEMETYEGKGSGYSLQSLDALLINLNKHKPLGVSCYIPLPEKILRKQACDNREIFGNECFKHAILAAENGKQYDFTGIEFPTKLKDIKWFQRKNNISINIYALDENIDAYPMMVCDEERDDHRDILLLTSEEEPDLHHYVWISNFNRLVACQKTKHLTALKAICKRCFSHFYSFLRYEEHKKLCNKTVEPMRAIMPGDDNYILKFKNYHRKIRVPFVIYADTEAALLPIDTCSPSPDKSFTNKYQKHEIMSYCYYVLSDYPDLDDSFNKAHVYTGSNAAFKLMNELMNVAKKIAGYYKQNREVILTDEDILHFETSQICHICQLPLNGDKIIEHEHVLGKYRGASHNSCNLAATTPTYVPIFFHFGSGYDMKYLIRTLGKLDGNINVLANTEEKYISFSFEVKGENRIWLRFLDSFRFLPSSLDQLVRSLKREHFEYLTKIYNGERLELLLRKGVFCYDYINDISKLDETQLPDKVHFYSKLNEADISDEDYDHAKKVWNIFEIKTLKEYQELYLTTDTYLLMEVFEKFRREFLNSQYGLDPVYYYGIPGLSWDGMLKITKVEMELIKDYDILQMFEAGVRGGFVQATTRYAKSDTNTKIAYIDANNLYAYASSQLMPSADFHFVSTNLVDLLTVSDKSPIGYIAEVDLRIPKEKHDYFNDFPLLPEKLILPGSKYKKLVATLDNKKNYILHYRTLQFAITHGIILEKVHRIVAFKQSQWLSPFIEINTEKRKLATNQFEKDFYKLINNSNFGKTIENVRKYQNIFLVNEWKRACRLMARPNFNYRTIYDDNLAVIHLDKTFIKFNKPIYVGFTILEMAKLHMYSFHYDVMLKYYGPERLKLAYTDTDSLLYIILTREDWRKEVFHALRFHFDFSDLPHSNPYYFSDNKKVLGKFKDEFNGIEILEYVALKAKMYSIKSELEEALKKAKGIKKNAVKTKLTFDDYKRILFSDKSTLHTSFNTIRSYKQLLYSVSQNKISLSSNDDKRYILPNRIDTLAHGHKNIEEEGVNI